MRKWSGMRWFPFVMMLASFAAAAPAGKPDFSGEWDLNLDRSDFGTQPAPRKMTQKIAHKDPELKVAVLEISPLDQEVTQDLKYVTDGTQSSNSVLGTPVKATVKWEGEELSLHSWAEFNGRTLDMKDRWRLTEGAATLIVTRHLEGIAGTFDQTIVFDKK